MGAVYTISLEICQTLSCDEHPLVWKAYFVLLILLTKSYLYLIGIIMRIQVTINRLIVCLRIIFFSNIVYVCVTVFACLTDILDRVRMFF